VSKELDKLMEILKHNVFIAEVTLVLMSNTKLTVLLDRLSGSTVLVTIWRDKKKLTSKYIPVDKVYSYVEQLATNLKPVEIKIRDLTRY